jgi:hypothetical protein
MPALTTVYTGAWIDWTNGAILGAKLTLTTRSSSYVVAFLALFVWLFGNALWSILARTLFLVRTTDCPKDRLYHQHQAILRNNSFATSSLWDFLRTGWNADGAENAVTRSAVYAVFASVYIAALGAATIFSSRLALPSSDVLLQSPVCGTFSVPPDLISQVNASTQNHANILEAAARDSLCGDAQDDGSNCQPFGRRKIDWSTSMLERCPFPSNICKTGRSVQLDSGLIDSHIHLGVNSPIKDRISYRRVLECSPIKTTGYSSGWTSDSQAGISGSYAIDAAAEEVMSFFYGPGSAHGLNMSATFIYSNLSMGQMSFGNMVMNYLQLE